MTTTSAIDLSRLPTPDVIETLDAEAIIAAAKADVLAIAPELAPVLALESELVVKLIEVFAFREVLLRARINDAADAVLLARATGTDLEHLAALYGVARLTISPADMTAVPPVAAVLETDAALRRRVQLALDGFSTAGPRAAYEFHALTADARVSDVSVDSPSPGAVRVVVLSSIGTGLATPDLLEAVDAALSADDVRPLCDTVNVQSATIVTYEVEATITMLEGPDPALVLVEAQAELAQYLASTRGVGRAVRVSGIYMALHRPGVERVTLTAPLADVLVSATEAAHCISTSVTVGAP